MFSMEATIVAISSSTYGGIRQIIRICGADAVNAVTGILGEGHDSLDPNKRNISKMSINVGYGTFVCFVYIFPKTASYTGNLMVELHVECPYAIAEAILSEIIKTGVSSAGPGEFTARAYLNGRLDLTQAEAVAEIISGSNLYQLTAAERLLKGKLSEYISSITDDILELISLLEAEMDFCDEGVMFITDENATTKLNGIVANIKTLIYQNIRREAMIGMPSVGIAGLPNAGKSRLLNKLTESMRSIVSSKRATTRDILTARLKLPNVECVLFDCAGLSNEAPIDILDQMGQGASIEALRAADIVLFCHDTTNDSIEESIQLLKLFWKSTRAPCHV